MSLLRTVRRGVVVVAIGLLALEGLLQAAALVAPSFWDPSPNPSAGGDAVTILVVGDSHAAGSGVPRDQTLGAHLEHMLAARHAGRSFRVVNLGIPGLNSAYVANRLDRNILIYRPALVIVWVGVNDLWNALETESWGGGVGLGLRRLLLHSKLYRLGVVLWHTSGPREVPGLERREQTPAGDEVARGLAADLDRMAATANAFGTPLVFVDYPVPYGSLNQVIWTAGERLGIPVVESANDLFRAMADGHTQDELLFNYAGPHPTGLLYRYVAESALPSVEAVLEGRRAGPPTGRADREAR